MPQAARTRANTKAGVGAIFTSDALLAKSAHPVLADFVLVIGLVRGRAHLSPGAERAEAWGSAMGTFRTGLSPSILVSGTGAMSEPGLTDPGEPWQRLIDSIGPHYCSQLLAARDRARGELRDLNEEQLESIAAEGRAVARSLDDQGARLTVNLTGDRERHSRLAADTQRQAQVLLRRQR